MGDADDFIKFLSTHNQQQTLTSDSRLKQLPEMLRTALPAAHALIEDWVEHMRRLQPKVVGLSSCYIQHLACLAMAKRLKEVCPETLVVLGGYNCTDVMGSETFRQFPFLDAVVSGPGEVVLVELVRRHLAGEKNIALPGVFWRNPDGDTDYSARIAPEPELDSLPIPAFDDFFEVREAWMGPVWVPVETSRGCWWGQKHHCIFCSENATALRFRRKSPERVYREITSLLERYPEYGIVANDEILDLKLIDSVMAPLAALPVKKRLHIAIKSNIRKDQLAALAAAGVVSLLPGIESLDDDVLRLMRKGVSALQNIQLLKWCKEFGLNVIWSILCGFPSEQAESYRRMSALLPLLSHLPPPNEVGIYRIRLQRFSPLYEEWKTFGLRDVVPNESYRYIYDVDEAELNKLAYRFDWDCERSQALDDNTHALRKAVATWLKEAATSALFYYDQNGCLGIGDTRPVAVRRVHKLTGAVRLVYLACERAQSLQAITTALSAAGHDLDKETVTDILASLVADFLMLEEKGLYLGLAHRVGRHSLPPMDIMAEVLGTIRNGAVLAP